MGQSDPAITVSKNGGFHVSSLTRTLKLTLFEWKGGDRVHRVGLND